MPMCNKNKSVEIRAIYGHVACLYCTQYCTAMRVLTTLLLMEVCGLNQSVCRSVGHAIGQLVSEWASEAK